MEPNTRGEELALHLILGDAGKTFPANVDGEERPLQKDHVIRFDFYSELARRRDLLASGQDDQSPAARVRLENKSGLAVMDRAARPITMPPDKFNRYLTDEGLDGILALRARLGQTDQPGRETYTRYLKSLVQERDPAAAAPSTLYKRRVEQRLEILLETDPGRLKPDGSLSVKILFDGKPLPGARVFGYCRPPGGPAPAVQTAVTSARGLAEFKGAEAGLWLVRLVYMRAAPEKRSETAAQWESFWATYTFAVRHVTAPPPGPAAKEG